MLENSNEAFRYLPIEHMYVDMDLQISIATQEF